MPTIRQDSYAAAILAAIQRADLIDPRPTFNIALPIVTGASEFTVQDLSHGLCTWNPTIIQPTDRQYAYIFLCGVWNSQSALNVANGYGSDRPFTHSADANDFGINTAFYADAERIFRRMIERTVTRDRLIVIYSHSAGGATAEVLASRFLRPMGYAVRSICTMGAPKPGVEGTCLNDVERVRYMANGDPVPGLPSIAAGSLIAALTATPIANRHVNQYCHGSGGVLINASGRAGVDPSVEACQDAFVQGDPARSFDRWLHNEEPEKTRHSINNYHIILTRVVVAAQIERQRIIDEAARITPAFEAADLRAQPPGQALRQPEEPSDVGLVQRFDTRIGTVQPFLPGRFSGGPDDVVVGTVYPQSPRPTVNEFPPNPPAAQAPPGGVIVATMRGDTVFYPGGVHQRADTRRRNAMATISIDRNMRWEVVTQPDGLPYISWHGQLIARAQTASAARTACRRANGLLRQLGKKLTIDLNNINAAFSAFLTDAAAGNGYRPPLNVV